MKKAMFIGIHMDECEYSCSGMTCLLKDAGWEVLYYNPGAFLHDKPENDTKANQGMAASDALGVKREMWEYEEKNVNWFATPENVRRIQLRIQSYAPDLLFIQWPKDNHPEHVEMAKASYYALSHAAGYVHIPEIYAYESGVNQTVPFFLPDFAIDITEYMPRIEASLMCYNIRHANGSGLCEEKRTVSHMRGLTHGCQYAEAYRIVKFPDGGDDLLLRQVAGDHFRWSGRMQYPAFGREYFT